MAFQDTQENIHAIGLPYKIGENQYIGASLNKQLKNLPNTYKDRPSFRITALQELNLNILKLTREICSTEHLKENGTLNQRKLNSLIQVIQGPKRERD
jgi:hypothetical protein